MILDPVAKTVFFKLKQHPSIRIGETTCSFLYVSFGFGDVKDWQDFSILASENTSVFVGRCILVSLRE